MPRIFRVLLWTVISLPGALALATIALHRGEQINPPVAVVPGVASYAFDYCFCKDFWVADDWGLQPRDSQLSARK